MTHNCNELNLGRKASDSLGNVMEASYDAQGNKTSETYGNGNHTQTFATESQTIVSMNASLAANLPVTTTQTYDGLH